MVNGTVLMGHAMSLVANSELAAGSRLAPGSVFAASTVLGPGTTLEVILQRDVAVDSSRIRSRAFERERAEY